MANSSGMSAEDQPANYACRNDDKRFIQSPERANARRIGWIYEVMRGWWDVEREEAFLELLEGKEEDVWLWRDGDEEALPEPDRWWTPPYALAAKALQMRQEASEHSENREMAEMRQRVQSESPVVRLAAIAWLGHTSKATKTLDSEHGMDSEEWNLWELIQKWWWFDSDVRNQLPKASTEEFEKAMEKEGHTCHTKLLSTKAEMLRQWLYVQSVLFPERAGAAVNFMHRDYADKISCTACRRYGDQHYSDHQDIFYEPAPYTAFLAVVHDDWKYKEPSFIEWIAALSSRYRKLTRAGHQLFQTLQSELRRQPEDLDTQFARWINSYPPDWHWPLSKHSSTTWKVVDSILDSSLSSRSSETIPDLGTWLAAVTWTACIHGQSLEVGQRVDSLNTRVKNMIVTLHPMPLPPHLKHHPPNTAAVETFRRKIRNSSHTCWDGHNPGWYASAVSYLNNDNDPKFVPGPRGLDWPCTQCSLVDDLHEFATAVSDSFQPGDQLSKRLPRMQKRFREYQCFQGYQQSYDDDQDSEVSSTVTDNEDAQVDFPVHPVSIAPDTIPQMPTSETITPQSVLNGSYHFDPYHTSDPLPAAVSQQTLLQSISIAQSTNLQSNPIYTASSTSDSVPQPAIMHIPDSIRTSWASESHDIFSFGPLPPTPPSYEEHIFSTSLPISTENSQTVNGLHRTSPLLPQPRAKKSRPRKAATIRQVKKYIVDELRGAGARLGMFRGEYTLPWTQLEQNLKEWKIEMINWPKDVERDDSIKGIHGLADTEVRLLWNAIHVADPEKRLQFRRLRSTVGQDTSRKRPADALDGNSDNPEYQSHGWKSLRVNANGSRSGVWDLTQESCS